DTAPLLETLLPLLAHPAELPGIDEYDLGLRRWVARMKGPRQTDATFLLRRLAALPAGEGLRATLPDPLDPPPGVAPAPPRPSGPRAAAPRRIPAPRRAPSRGRPDLRAAARGRPIAVRAVHGREARILVDLAREAMVTRQRDLDAFADGDARDVRIVTFEDGLE